MRRVVHVSVANPDHASPFPYYRGKAQTEDVVRESGLSYAIVRPTLVFGPDDVLVNNIAWGLRHVPLFLVPGDGRYEVQLVSVRDTAAICVDAGMADGDVVLDAAGPSRWTFEDFVRLIARAVGSRAWIRRAPPAIALAASRLAGLAMRDTLLTRDELGALMAGLIVSHEEPLGARPLRLVARRERVPGRPPVHVRARAQFRRMIVLASTSPQRRAILEQLRIPFRVVAPAYEEVGDDPVEHAVGKARSVDGGGDAGARRRHRGRAGRRRAGQADRRRRRRVHARSALRADPRRRVGALPAHRGLGGERPGGDGGHVPRADD